MTEKKEKIIGIDLGTSNSQASVVIGGKPVIIPSAEGATIAGKMFPSVVAFTKDNQMLIGEAARRQAINNPEGTVMKAKRMIGSDFKYKIYGKEYTPQQISAFILQKIKSDAEAFLGEPVKKAVITVPAYFNDNQSGIAEFKIAKQLCDQSSDKSVTIGVHKFPIIEFDNDNNCIVIDDTFNSFVGDSNLQE